MLPKIEKQILQPVLQESLRSWSQTEWLFKIIIDQLAIIRQLQRRKPLVDCLVTGDAEAPTT